MSARKVFILKELSNPCRRRSWSSFLSFLLFFLLTGGLFAQDYQFTAYTDSYPGYGSPTAGKPYTITVHIANLPSPKLIMADGSKVVNVAEYDLLSTPGNTVNLSVDHSSTNLLQKPNKFIISVYHADVDSGASLIGSGINIIIEAALNPVIQISLYGPVSLFPDLNVPTTLPPLSAYKRPGSPVPAAGILYEHYNPIVSFSASAAIPCPQYQEMLAESKELYKLANDLETNKSDYEEAVIDILCYGYESSYAMLAIGGIHDSQIPDAFPDSAAIRAARPKIIANIREKATVRATIATMGMARSGHAPTTVVDANYTHFATKAVLDYFCSPSPDKMTLEVWTALWAAGYTDFDTFNEVGYQMFAARVDRALLISSIASFLAEFAAEPLFYRMLPVGKLEVATVRARLFDSLAQGKLPPVITRYLDNRWLTRIRSQVRSKLPTEAGEGEVSRVMAHGKGAGVRWVGKKYYIRIDRGNPVDSRIWQRIDHVSLRYNGKTVGRGGKILPDASLDTEAAHIPLDDWLSWKQWYQP